MKGLKWELSVYRMDNRGERERIENRIERLMLLISSWKIESVEWLLSLRCSIMMKPLTRFQYHRYNYRTQTRSKIVRSMLNVTESGQHFVYSIIINIPLESLFLEQRQKLFSNLFTKLQ